LILTHIYIYKERERERGVIFAVKLVGVNGS
jgi:hypothetical protein